jgi:hypothetical protein
LQAITKTISGTDVKPAEGVDWGLESGDLVGRIDEKGLKWVAEKDRATAESRLASEVYRAMVEGNES